MMRRLLIFTSVLVLAGFAALAVAGWLAMKPGPLAETKRVLIPKGTGTVLMGEVLTQEGVIAHPRLFAGVVWVTRGKRAIHAGEYEFPPNISLVETVDFLLSGRTYYRRFVVAEGITSWNIIEMIKAEQALTGEAGEVPPEGALMPDTYYFSFGDERAVIVGRMRTAMETFLSESLSATPLPPELPDRNALLTLASIVEKETGKPEERPMVAAVYLNRLRVGMPLQADPTVIYGITKGEGDQGRNLTYDDLKSDTPYNTYRVATLPPGPIANPGRASILAVLKPAETKALYFVADGAGGHRFAETLEEHNKNVALYRAWQKERKSATAD